MNYFDEDINDDKKLYAKYNNKKVNAKAEGLECLLTYPEYCQLVREAGLVSSQLGFTGENYVLARYQDEGNYELGNCRFITQKENYNEKFKTDAELNNWHKVKPTKIYTTQQRSSFIKNSQKWQQYNNQRKQKAQEHQLMLDNKKHSSYKGKNNSQYGTFWITDGVTNQKWSEDKGLLPDTYYKGRTI